MSIIIESNGQGWQWLNPKPQGNHIHSIQFLNPSLGYCTGTSGLIMKTTDGGNTWSMKNILEPWINPTTFSTSFFPTVNTGYTGGVSDYLYKTTDGGLTWNGISNTPEYLTCMFFTDSLHGFTAGSFGHGYITSDGGMTWQTIQLISNYEVNSTFFTSQQEGYMAGGVGTIWHTGDGGSTWNIQSTSITTNPLYSILFTTQSKGFAVGAKGALFKTQNAGITWNYFPLSDSLYLWDIGSFNTDTLLVIASNDFHTDCILRSTDGGNTWTIHNLPFNFPANLTRLSFTGNGTVLAAGNEGSLIKSTDGGITWNSLSFCATSLPVKCITYANNNTVYATTSADYTSQYYCSILKSVDGGNNWLALDTMFQFESLNTVCFISDSWGCVAGEKIYSTSDGGSSWILRYSSNLQSSVNSMAFADGVTGFAVGYGGTVVKTHDMGQSWETIPSGTSNDLYSICFPNSSTGYIAGNNTILKTTNKGATWTMTQVNEALRGIYFITPDIGFATGGSIIKKTINGGLTWTDFTVGGSPDFNAISFYDLDTGYVVGGYSDFYSNVYKTTDRGQTWHNEFLPSEYPFYSVAISKNYSVLVGGYFGFIFGTSNGGWTGYLTMKKKDDSGVLICFPNPASTTMKFQASMTGNLRIFNLSGEQVFQQDITSPTITLDISNLPAGVYFVKLVGRQRVEVGKVVIQR